MKKLLKKFGIKIILIIIGIMILSMIIDLIYALYKLENTKVLEPLVMYAEDANGNKIPLVLAKYKIMNEYFADEKILINDYLNYDFQDEGVLMVYLGDTYNVSLNQDKSFSEYDIEVSRYDNGVPIIYYDNEYKIKNDIYEETSVEYEGEVLRSIKIDAKDKNYEATYIYKEIVLDKNDLQTSNKYINSSLSDEKRVEEIISKIKYPSFINKYEVNIEENKLLIEYNIQLPEKEINKISKLLFVLFDDLNLVNITVNESANIKTQVRDNLEKNILEYKDYSITREKFKNDLITIEELKEFLDN